jgi:hypothetical protein
MTALNLTYYPLSQNAQNDHFNPEGHLFFGQLLAHDLIRDGYIPWSRPAGPPPAESSSAEGK